MSIDFELMTLNPTAEQEGLSRWRLHRCVLVCTGPSHWPITHNNLSFPGEWYPGNNNKELLWVVAVSSCLPFLFFLSPLGQIRRGGGASNLSKAPFCIIYWPLLHLPCCHVLLSEKAPLQSVRKTLRSLFTSTNRQAEGHSQVCVSLCVCVYLSVFLSVCGHLHAQLLNILLNHVFNFFSLLFPTYPRSLVFR